MTRETVFLGAYLAVLISFASAGVASAAQNPDGIHREVVTAVRVLVANGDLDGAEQRLLQALPLSPAPAQIYYELGCIHEKRGDHAKAITAFKEGIRIHEEGRRGKP